jgi:type I restriction enzyme S subunit
VRTEWATKTLADVCRFSNGLWKGEKPPFANVGVVRNTNFTKDGTLDYSDIAYLDVEANKLEKRRLQFGDIILEKSGGGPKQPVGRVALFDRQDGDFSFSNFTASLRVLAPDEIDFRFLHMFLYWTYVSGATEGMQSHSTGIRNLNADAYRAIEFGYPPLSEQQRIVGILDEAFVAIATARANTEQNLSNAREVFDRYLNGVFTTRGEGWAERRLGAICGFVRGPFGGSLKKAMFVDDGYAVYEQSHAISNQFTDIRYFIDERKFSEMRRFEVYPNDIVMSCAGTMGRTAIVPEGVRPGIINQALLKLTPSSEVLAAFLKSWMESEDFQDALKAYAAGAAIQNVASVKVLKDIRVPVPSLAEQHRIVVLLGQASFETHRLTSLYQRKLAALDALKQSLLHQAFTGAL